MLTNETLKIIKARRSIRSYTPVQIKEEALQAVLEAGRYAPFAVETSRHFTVVQNKNLIDRLNAAAKAAAAQMGIPGVSELGRIDAYHCLYHAPTVMIISGNESSPGFESDCAAAAENMLIAAESLGLGSCWIYFTMLAFMSSEGDKLKKELQIPDGFNPFCSVAIGYKASEVTEQPERKADAVNYIR